MPEPVDGLLWCWRTNACEFERPPATPLHWQRRADRLGFPQVLQGLLTLPNESNFLGRARDWRRTLVKTTPPDRGIFAIIAHTLVFRDGEVLLLRRANTGVMDGYFALPGGHRQRGETVVETAARECKEEAGVVVRKMRPVAVLPYANGANFIFEAIAWQGAPVIVEPARCDALVFAPEDALPRATAPFVATALRCRRERTWYREAKAEAAEAPNLLQPDTR